MLFSTLEKPLPRPSRWNRRIGAPQVALAAVTFCVSCFVLFTFVVSKLSLVALVEGFHYYRLEDDVDPAKKKLEYLEAHCTLLMMILTLTIPAALGLISNLREW